MNPVHLEDIRRILSAMDCARIGTGPAKGEFAYEVLMRSSVGEVALWHAHDEAMGQYSYKLTEPFPGGLTPTFYGEIEPELYPILIACRDEALLRRRATAVELIDLLAYLDRRHA